jgi:hypothetical protein
MTGAITQPLAPTAANDVTNKAYVDSIVSSFLPLAGGTMTGAITQPLAPTSGNDLVNKTYADSIVSSFLPLTGGTMTGAITQPLAPTSGNDLANKTYVDAQVSSVVIPDATTSIKGKLQLAGDLSGTAAAPLVASKAITNTKLDAFSNSSQLKGSSSTSTDATDIALGNGLIMSNTTLDVNTSNLSSTFLPLAGGIMTGAIVQPLAPTSGNDVTNKSYVDSFLPLTGGAMTGAITQPLAPTSGNDLVNKTYADNIVTGFLPLAGGSMTGAINQPLAPTSGNDLVNKSYVDSFLPLTGGTMTGAINQPLAPTSGNDLVNKTYADNIVTGFLPLTGGAMTGAIVQPLAPTSGNDLVNKTYTDDTYQAKKPSITPGQIAMFGSGADVGQTVDSGFTIDTNLANPSSNTTLWPSNRIIGIVQFGAAMYKATASITLPISGSAKAFSTGNSDIGPAVWPTSGTTFSIGTNGIITIFNSLSYDTYFKLSFSANSLTETIADTSVECSFFNDDTSSLFGITKTLRSYHPGARTNQVLMSALVAVDPVSSLNFSVLLVNSSAEAVTIDSTVPKDVSFVTIQRVA